MHTIGFIPNMGGYEWLVLLIIGLLLFGRRLPEVGRSLGKGIVEFKRGLKGIEDEIEEESSKPSRSSKPLPESEQVGSSPSQAQAPAEPRVSRADSA